MTDLLLVPLEDTVVFPGMNVTLTVDVGDDDRVVLVPRHENEYAAVPHVHDGGPAPEEVRAAALQRPLVGRVDLDPREAHADHDAVGEP
ncbi:MAG TPA: hypothetical protein VJ814_06435, partial [Gaiellaceae bacterium]|nr:hypothetical protein [Gaiellaceae bacterium]